MIRLPRRCFPSIPVAVSVALIAAAALVVPSAHAQTTVNYGVTLTTMSPTFNRPSGGATYYQSQAFFVDTTGSYNLETTSANLPGSRDGNDTYLFLYRNSFNPATPSANLLAQNDDISRNTGGNVANRLSLISTSLTSSTQYFLISTTYDSNLTGTINTRISGPAGTNITLGNVSAANAVPEPGTIALLLTAGVPVIGIVRRRATKSI